MKKVLFAFTCLCGLCGCLNMNDDSTIDESSIVITRGKIRDVYVEAYVDVEAKGMWCFPINKRGTIAFTRWDTR